MARKRYNRRNSAIVGCSTQFAVVIAWAVLALVVLMILGS